MTREEAIRCLSVHSSTNGSGLCTDKQHFEAKQMAIKALEQKPCDNWHDVPSDEMTLEQARQAVKDLRKKLVKYLEQESCEDAISRQAAIDSLNQSINILEATDRIAELPSVTAKQRWIPVSERLPEEYGEYLITWTTSQSKRPFIGISEGEITSEYDHAHNRFKFEWLLEGYYPDAKVIAWMPLPKPFEPQESEEQT